MSELALLGSKLFNAKEEFRPKIISTSKRVRGILAGEYIFDTTSAKMVWENGFFPWYWIPQKDFLPAANFIPDKPISGIQSSTSRLSVKDKSIASLLVPDSFNSELAGYVKVQHADLDEWYEEDSSVLYHPKDPYHRIDILPTSRRIRVEIDGVVLADSKEGGVMSLWETNFPGRWYLPHKAISWDLLKPSTTTTGCPYKGQAKYYNAIVNGVEHKDVVWWYEDPVSESADIKDMLCFYPEKVQIFVNGRPDRDEHETSSQTTKNQEADSLCNC